MRAGLGTARRSTRDAPTRKGEAGPHFGGAFLLVH